MLIVSYVNCVQCVDKAHLSYYIYIEFNYFHCMELFIVHLVVGPR